MPLTYYCDRFTVTITTEALYIEGMGSVMVDLDGDADSPVNVSLDVYELMDVLFMTSAPMGRHILPYSLKWLMINHANCEIKYDDIQLTCNSQAEWVFNQFNDIAAMKREGLDVDIALYPGTYNIFTTGTVVSAGFAFLTRLVLRNYAGVAKEWQADRTGTKYLL